MASRLYHDPCPVCNGDIESDQPAFVFGLDLTVFPPMSLTAHKACLAARCWRGFVLIRPGQSLGEILGASTASAGVQLALLGMDQR